MQQITEHWRLRARTNALLGSGRRQVLLMAGVVFVPISTVIGQVRPPPPERPLPATMPTPAENPLTPAKAVLGKILFWEEQLSADDTTACGSCHVPSFGGSDPRSFAAESVHPGLDAAFGTDDDVRGSKGVVAQTVSGELIDDGTFYPERQVTGRRSMTVINAGLAPELFWDGRARGAFVDPESGEEVIPTGGALEIQALGPILSTAEMSSEGRTWEDVKVKLRAVRPLQFALTLPSDVETALRESPSYPELFESAFGSPEITARKIAFAIASYERTLLANQTPFDEFARGNDAALTVDQVAGLQTIRRVCAPCHNGPDFSDHQFHNTGVRPIAEDVGRQEVSGNPDDAGRFKTPSLRNVANRGPFFHDGGPETLADVIAFYNRGGDFRQNVARQIRRLDLNGTQRRQIREFLEIGLSDPRVDAGLPPFDHPTLRSHFRRGDANRDGIFDLSDAIFNLGRLFLSGGDLPCLDASDANDDGQVDLSDSVAILNRLFLGTPPLPYPTARSTGPDVSDDDLDCEDEGIAPSGP